MMVADRTVRVRPGIVPGPPLLHTGLSWLVVFVVVVSQLGPSVHARQEDAPTESCAITDNGYTVEVCLTAPPRDVPILDDVTISATVTLSESDVKVRSVVFEFDDRRILTDFDLPYEFTLPISYWESGTMTLTAKARLNDDTESEEASAEVTIANTAPLRFSGRTFEPPTGRPAVRGESFVLAAIGDRAGGSPQSAAVSDLMSTWNPNLLLYLGDVYNSGTYTEYMNWYDPDEYMGRFRDITLPTPGNHEYGGGDTPRGYMEYWGNPPHYYSVDAAGWHIVSLDSNPKFTEGHGGSEQLRWLEDDLSSAQAACTVVFFHHPPFSVGSYRDEHEAVEDIWDMMVEHDVTLVLGGHDHNYQRWQPLDADGNTDSSGPVPVVVGTGGQSMYSPRVEDSRLASPSLTVPGALRLELNQNAAALQFASIDGIVRDSAVVPCGETDTSDTAPSAPTNITAVREADGSVALRWAPAVDERGIVHYEIYRDGAQVADGISGFSYIDADAPENHDPGWYIVAVDAAGNRSPASARVTATSSPDTGAVFADSFASGTLERWDEVDGMAISPATDAGAGSYWVARARGSSDTAHVLLDLPDELSDGFEANFTFKVLDQGENPLVFLRVRNPEGDSMMSVNAGANRTLGVYNDLASSGTTSSIEVDPGEWHELTFRLWGPPGDRYVEIVLDGVLVTEISGEINLGVDSVSAIQLGDSTTGRVYDVEYSEFSLKTMPSPATPQANATPLAALPPSKAPSAARTMLGRGKHFKAHR